MSREYDDLITSTLDRYQKSFESHILQSNVLLHVLSKNGRKKINKGGNYLTDNVAYDGTDFKWYGKGDSLPRNFKETFTRVEYEAGACAASITLDNLELVKNRGKDRLFSLLEGQVDLAKETLNNNVTKALYSDGSIENSFDGLETIVSETPETGVVGGIDAEENEWWRNQVMEVPAEPTFDDLRETITKMSIRLTRGASKPDIILMGSDWYTTLVNGAYENKRLMKSNLADLGFQAVKIGGIDVVMEGFDTHDMQKAYVLNTKNIKFQVYEGRNFQVIDLNTTTPDRDAITKHIGFYGGLTCNNRSRQGLIKAAA